MSAGEKAPLIARRFGVPTASALVVASMIGTGVFTTSGPLLETVGSPAAVLLVWVVGGLVSLAGALSYAEIGTTYPEAGGEYAILKQALHPAIGFAAGFVSITAGFAAPIAVCSLAFASYLAAVWPWLPEIPLALGLVLFTTLLHAQRAELGVGAQNALTLLKIVLTVALALLGLFAIDPSRFSTSGLLAETARPSFGLGVVQVFFAYTGWNAAVYVAGDLKDPARTLPRALTYGTLLVTAVYVALNAVFVLSVPVEVVRGETAIAERVMNALYGPALAHLLAVAIALGLISTVGAFVLSGTRVYLAMAADAPRLRWLARGGRRGEPVVALAVQAGLASLLILTSTLRDLLSAVGMALSITSALTVVAVFVERRRLARSGQKPLFSTPGYPVTPVLYLLLLGWVVVGGSIERPDLLAVSLVTLALGGVGFVVFREKSQ